MIYFFKTVSMLACMAATIYFMKEGQYGAAGWFGFFTFLSIIYTGN